MTYRLLSAALAVSALVSGCSTYGDYGPSYAGDGSSPYARYDYDHPDPTYGGYYADRYYRDDPRYTDRVMTRDERIYRGENGQYYCRRSDGTTGLIVGGLAGGVLGNVLAPGHSEVLGTVLGAAGGAIIGSEIEKNGAHCR